MLVELVRVTPHQKCNDFCSKISLTVCFCFLASGVANLVVKQIVILKLMKCAFAIQLVTIVKCRFLTIVLQYQMGQNSASHRLEWLHFSTLVSISNPFSCQTFINSQHFKHTLLKRPETLPWRWLARASQGGKKYFTFALTSRVHKSTRFVTQPMPSLARRGHWGTDVGCPDRHERICHTESAQNKDDNVGLGKERQLVRGVYTLEVDHNVRRSGLRNERR